MPMTKERRGEIAYAVLRHFMSERSVEVGNDFRRRVGKVAKETGIPFGEVLEFSTTMTAEILADVSGLGVQPTKEELEGAGGSH